MVTMWMTLSKPLILCTKKILPLAKTFLPNIPAGCIPSLKTEMCGVFFHHAVAIAKSAKHVQVLATICGWRVGL